MPRRLVDCRSCQRRFIASALDIHECEFCCCSRGTIDVVRPAMLHAQKASLPTTATADHSPAQHSPRKRSSHDLQEEVEVKIKHQKTEESTIDVDENQEEEEEEEGSEADDDMHCTQICHSQEADSSDEEEDLDNKPLIQLVKNRQFVREGDCGGLAVDDSASILDSFGVKEGSSSVEDGGADNVAQQGQDGFVATPLLPDHDTCLVCGASLVHLCNLKARLNHMKRCSKKNGVSAKDVRWDDDHEMFIVREESTLNTNSTTTGTSSPKINNPYAKRNRDWSSGAAMDLAMAAPPAGVLHPPLGTSSSGGGKPSLPSVNSVLMAGARCAAKMGPIQIKAASAAQKRQQGRQPWTWSGKPKGACPSYKKIPGTDFCVDGFHYIAETKNFFLSHFHSDHYGGITSSWDSGTIYCSLATANLVNQQLGVDRTFLHPLPLLTPVVVETQGRAVVVTLIDANHCPGAVMFLFQVGSRSILHVGDFRWDRNVMQAQSPLRAFFSGKTTLDILYLDTTYCDAKYTLPTQDAAIKAAIEMAVRELESARRSKKSILMLFGAYTIGKERIYLAVAENLKLKVYVDSRRYRILKQLGLPSSQMDLLTTKPGETALWVVPLGHINMKNLPTYLKVHNGSFHKNFDRVVGFRPTGWSHSSGGNGGIIKTTSRGNITVHGVPYSEHSSFPELLDCLRCLKPKRIIPTVSVSKSQQQVDLLLSRL